MIRLYLGKSAAGKDTFVKKTMEFNPDSFNLIVSCTTRPMRDGEVEGMDYHFVSRNDFLSMIHNDQLMEYREYHTLVNNKPDTWYYGTKPLDKSKNWVGVVELKGAEKFIDYYGGDNIELVYVETDDYVREQRAKARGSFDKKEWDRRLEDDSVVFSRKVLDSLVEKLGHSITVINNTKDIPTFSSYEDSLYERDKER